MTAPNITTTTNSSEISKTAQRYLEKSLPRISIFQHAAKRTRSSRTKIVKKTQGFSIWSGTKTASLQGRPRSTQVTLNFLRTTTTTCSLSLPSSSSSWRTKRTTWTNSRKPMESTPTQSPSCSRLQIRSIPITLFQARARIFLSRSRLRC